MGMSIGGGGSPIQQVPVTTGGGPTSKVDSANGGGATAAPGAQPPTSTLPGGPGGALEGASNVNPKIVAALQQLVQVLTELIAALKAQAQVATVGGGGPEQKGGGPAPKTSAPPAAPQPTAPPTS